MSEGLIDILSPSSPGADSTSWSSLAWSWRLYRGVERVYDYAAVCELRRHSGLKVASALLLEQVRSGVRGRRRGRHMLNAKVEDVVHVDGVVRELVQGHVCELDGVRRRVRL